MTSDDLPHQVELPNVELRVQLVPPAEWLEAIVASTSKQGSKAKAASKQVEYGFEAY